jgi:general stress protein CsbA
MSARREPEQADARSDLARWVGGALQAGGAVSIAVVASGLLLGMTSITGIGLFLVVLTPIAHLAAAAAAFVRHRERGYAIVTVFVLSMVAGSLLIAALFARNGS